MKQTVFVKATVGDNGSRIVFGRKATESRGHREVTQYGCFGDGVAEEVQEKLLNLLSPTAWEGQEDEIFLSGRVEVTFNVVGEPEEYEVPEDFVPEDLKTITVFTTPVEIIGVAEPAEDTFTALARKALTSGKPKVLKQKA